MILDIIIVNWNSGEQLRHCLRSIPEAVKKNILLNRVIVVDNASADASADISMPKSNLPLTVIRNHQNIGFAAACNQGARMSRADYLLFLNPDTRLFSDSLKIPLEFMEKKENQRIGITGIQLCDEKGRISRSCCRRPEPKHFFSKLLGLDKMFPSVFPSHFMDEWPHEHSRKVFHVIGAFFLVRQNIFQQLNGFDEHYFVYMEDIDFSLRMHQAGFDSYYLSEARAFHKGGGTSEQIKARRLFYALKSRIIYGHKHFKQPAAVTLAFSTLMVEPIARLVFLSTRHSFKDISETVTAFFLLWQDIRTLIKYK